MACNSKKVWLGFEDEFITDKIKGTVNFATNKIGGNPDWPSNKNGEVPVCTLCQLPKPLILQLYAPLDNFPYHRTLYLFACINPNCWNHGESWTCIRMQSLEQTPGTIEIAQAKSNTSVTEWCQDADDWEDKNANVNEENGNVVSNIGRISDEDDESCSIEESIRCCIGNLTVDDRNANMGIAAEAQGGAVGRLHSPGATAEIEGDEGEVISIDSPTLPQCDLVALLQEATPLPQDFCNRVQSDGSRFNALQFVPVFISVWEETDNQTRSTIDSRVKELLLEYQQKTQEEDVASSDGCGALGEEQYEKSTPAHGDKMFYYFLSKIQSNPGQILRYSRDGASPLLLYPLTEMPHKCEYCDGEMVFEFQALPTLIPKLRLTCDGNDTGPRLEFGTVLVFTCRRSCWGADVNSRKEIVILQTEKY